MVVLTFTAEDELGVSNIQHHVRTLNGCIETAKDGNWKRLLVLNFYFIKNNSCSSSTLVNDG